MAERASALVSRLFSDGWAARFAAAGDRDPELRALSPRREYRFRWAAGPRARVVTVTPESVRVDPGGAEGYDFSLAADEEAWGNWLLDVPPPGYHDVLAMWNSAAGLRVEGDMLRFSQYLAVTRRVLELARAACREEPPARAEPAARPRAGHIESVVGRYLTVEVQGEPVRLYFEEAGEGPPVLLLHTAGSDSRQYRFQLGDPDYAGSRLLAFDLPYHGRSLPPDGWWDREFRLTQDYYAAVVEAFCDALELDRPVLVGVSMAAQVVLELALRRPGGYRAIAAFGAVDHVGRQPPPWLHHPEVNESELVPSWVAGMASPTVSLARRKELWWCYSQSGAGVFAGDANFFMAEWDARGRLASLDTGNCPVHLFAGEYDYSRPPDRVRATAAQIPGATFTELSGCGHFPVIEDPRQVKGFLLPLFAVANNSTPGNIRQ